MHHVQNLLDPRLDVVNLLAGECGLKEFPYRKRHLLARNHLPRESHREVFINMNHPFLRLQGTRNHLENRRLSRAVLPHERNLRPLPHRKIRVF